MILAHRHIVEALDSGAWTAHRDGVQVGSDKLTVNANSINVSLGDKMLVPVLCRSVNCFIDLHEPDSVTFEEVKDTDLVKTNQFHIMPGSFSLMHVRERFDCAAPLDIDGKLRHFAPMIEGRSTVARCGLSIHQCAGFGDVNFISNYVLEITTALPVILRTGDEIAQVYFIEVSDGSVKYSGAYTDQHDEPKAPVLGKDRFQRF